MTRASSGGQKPDSWVAVTRVIPARAEAVFAVLARVTSEG
jgi:hypothetical protein